MVLGFFVGGGEVTREVPRIGGADGASSTSEGERVAAARVGTSIVVAFDVNGRDGDRTWTTSRRLGAQGKSTSPRRVEGALALENAASVAPEGMMIGEAEMAIEPGLAVGESEEPRAAEGDPVRAEGSAGEGVGVGVGGGVAAGTGGDGVEGGRDGGVGVGDRVGDGVGVGVGVGDRGEDQESGVTGAAGD
eukprot:scaffold153415_cov63-Attheya_sp.AAC.2